MLNMLIAIMGNTFGEVFAEKELNGTMTKLDLMGELADNIYLSAEDRADKKVFMFVVTVDDRDESQEAWE